MARTSWWWRSRTTGARRPPAKARSRPPADDRQTPTGRFAGRADQARAWSACASGWPPSAAGSPPGPRPAGGSGLGVPGRGPPPPRPRREYRVIRVLLADDQALVRAGFRALLDAQEGIEVVGEAA